MYSINHISRLFTFNLKIQSRQSNSFSSRNNSWKVVVFGRFQTSCAVTTITGKDPQTGLFSGSKRFKTTTQNSTSPGMTDFLVALDFDHTIVEGNSDIVVRDLLRNGVPRSVEDLHTENGWTRYMQEVFRLLSAEGFTEKDIHKAVVSIRPVPDFPAFFRQLKQMNAEVIIISDANSYFIRSWLKEYDLVHCVDRVFTNPAKFDMGILQIKEYMNQDWCPESTVNLCKGHILDSYKEERRHEGKTFSRTFYIGDGSNDYCPSLRLSEEDVTFPRKGFPLLKKLKASKELKAKFCPWSHSDEIMDVIQINLNST